MAIVNITHDTIEAIVGQVRHTFNQERMQIIEQQVDIPEGIGDEIHSWLISRENNKKILEAMPFWHRPIRKMFYLKVNSDSTDCKYSPVSRLRLNEEWYSFSGTWVSPIVTGVDSCVWDGNLLNLFIKDTEAGLPEGPAKDFVKGLFSISEQHQKITDKTNAAENTMREFLGQHRTLQTALKECPAIMSYIPDWMQNELKRIPTKRTRRPPIPKSEKKEIDMSQLVAQATIAKLNL